MPAKYLRLLFVAVLIACIFWGLGLFVLLREQLSGPVAYVAASETPAPTPTQTVRPTDTRSPTFTSLPTQTASPTVTATATATRRATATQYPTVTRRPTQTASPTVTSTRTPTATPTLAGPHAILDGIDPLRPFPVTGAWALRFTRPMDPASAEPPLSTFPWVEGDLAWDETHTRLTFTPKTPLASETTYHLYLSRDLLTADGQPLASTQEWTLVTQSGPKVVKRQPVEGLLTTRRPQIQIEFDRPMDAGSVAAAFSVQPMVPYTLTWQTNTLTIATAPLTPGERYAFTVGATAADAQGAPLGEDLSYGYWLTPFQATISGPTYEKRTSPLSIVFNYSLDPARAAAAFSLTPLPAGESSWHKNSILTYRPQDALPLGETYVVSFTQPLLDLAGDPLPDLGVLTYTVPVTPAIVAVRPIGEFEIITRTVEIDFNRPMDQASVEAAFKSLPAIAGAFSWRENTLVFTLSDSWPDRTEFTFWLEASARDADGHIFMIMPYVWGAYSSSSYDPYSSHSYYDVVTAFRKSGPNVQVVNAEGPRAIQVMVEEEITATFELYQLDWAQFVTVYRDGFTTGWLGRPTIDLADARRVAAWPYIPESGSGEDGYSGYSRAQLTYLPVEASPGLYVLNLKRNDVLADQLFVALTRYALVVKRSGDDLLVWASDFDNAAVPQMAIGLYNQKGEKIRQGQTDANGLWRTTLYGDSAPMFVAANRGKDFTITGVNSTWGDYGDPAVKQYAAYIYTDRPIYRPGQTVYFKAIVRKDDDARYETPPKDTPVTLRVHDGRDNLLQTDDLSINEYGTVNGEFQLAGGAMLGEYQIEVLLGEESYRQAFKVEDYRKPEYQVLVTADVTQTVKDTNVHFTVTADYFFGQPVAGAAVQVKTYFLAPSNWWCMWEACDTAGEGDYIWYAPYYYGERPPSYTSGELNPDGAFTFDWSARLSDQDYYDNSWIDHFRSQIWGFEATVTDASGQSVSGFVVVRVYSAAEQVIVETGSFYKQPGTPFTIDAQVKTIRGQPVAGRSLLVDLRQWSREDREYKTMASDVMTTTQEGIASLPWTIQNPGYYQLRVISTDETGRRVANTRWLYVFKDASTWMENTGAGDLSITAEKGAYAPYETARLIIESSFSGPALLTFERGSVIHTKLVDLTAPLTVVDVEIIPEDAPNVYVTVNAWRGQDITHLGGGGCWDSFFYSLGDATLLRSSVQLKVSAASQLLNVTLIPDQTTYAPGEDATFTIQVTDFRGNPVQAELSLALVDEAIFTLSEDLSGSIFSDGFYRTRRRTVLTYHSMEPSRSMLAGGGCGGGGGGEFMIANPRSDFPDTALWLPVVETDRNGKATVTLTLPDNLTTWRAVARAVTTRTQVGDGSAKIVTQKPVVVRPSLPRALAVGDQFDLSAFIHNYTAEAITLTAAVAIPDGRIEISGALTQTITLPPGGVQFVQWPARALRAGETQIHIQVLPSPLGGRAGDEGLTDAVLLPLTIQPLAIPEVVTQAGAFERQWFTNLYLPEGALDISAVYLDLSRSLAGGLLDGLEYLTGYPYGCVEQTMSRALPNAVVGRAFEQLGTGDPARQQALDPLIRAGLQRLYGFQHNDGGWGWWTDDATHDYQTAWVVFGLSVTAEAGYEVDAQVIARGAQWLQKNLESMDIRTRAYALYAMAVSGHGDLDATRALAARLNELDAFSQAGLALAFHRLGAEAEADDVLNALAASAVTRDGLVYWPQPQDDGEYHGKTMASTIRATALVLDAFTQIDPQHALAPGMARWLVAQRRPLGWGSTNETAYAILALTDHLLSVQEATVEAPYTVELNGQAISTGVLTAEALNAALEIPAAQLQPGVNQLRVSTPVEGQLYFSLAQRVYLPQTAVAAVGGIQIEREYLAADGKALTQPLVVGQLVQVRLTVTLPQRGFFLILEDHLPGGLEALNERLATTSHDASAYEPHYYWEEYHYNMKEVRGDRVTFFITEPYQTTLTFTYLARVTQSGVFIALPAEMYAMYDPSLWGRSASSVLTTESQPQPAGAPKPR